MIRINLAKTHNYTSSGTQTAIAMDQAAALASGGPHPAVKIAIMIILPIILYIYESYNITQKSIELAKVQTQVQQIEAEVAQFGSVKTVVEDLVKERNKLNEQLSVIQKISQKRAFKLKAINQIQVSLLDDLWLEQLTVDQSVMDFQGLSRSPTSINEIVENLNKNDFIESAFNKEMNRKKIGKEVLQQFNIEARIKN